MLNSRNPLRKFTQRHPHAWQKTASQTDTQQHDKDVEFTSCFNGSARHLLVVVSEHWCAQKPLVPAQLHQEGQRFTWSEPTWSRLKTKLFIFIFSTRQQRVDELQASSCAAWCWCWTWTRLVSMMLPLFLPIGLSHEIRGEMMVIILGVFQFTDLRNQ